MQHSLLLMKLWQREANLYDLPDYAVVQINDTHPTMVIPELIRLLLKKGIGMDDAIRYSYQNVHILTIQFLVRGIEKWPGHVS